MSAITFSATLYTIGGQTIVHLPEPASKQLPSRGQAMAEATINGVEFKTPLEPDGNWSHWFELDKPLQKKLGITAGDTVDVTLQPTKDWPEPPVPQDIQKALNAAPQIQEIWQKITPMSRWEWVRWIRSTNNDATRAHRIEVAISKMENGKRRPCCWNRNMCTDPSVSKGGVLLEPARTV